MPVPREQAIIGISCFHSGQVHVRAVGVSVIMNLNVWELGP